MRLYSEINLNEQLDRLYLTPKQKDKVRYMIENIEYKYSKRLDEFEKENAELKMKLLTLENKEQIVTTTVSN